MGVHDYQSVRRRALRERERESVCVCVETACMASGRQPTSSDCGNRIALIGRSRLGVPLQDPFRFVVTVRLILRDTRPNLQIRPTTDNRVSILLLHRGLRQSVQIPIFRLATLIYRFKTGLLEKMLQNSCRKERLSYVPVLHFASSTTMANRLPRFARNDIRCLVVSLRGAQRRSDLLRHGFRAGH
jgi:hypothetical protein